jgi:hypothetical protein
MTSTFECVQYEVEGNIDFFKELKQISNGGGSVLSMTPDSSASSNEKRCLLTDETLHPDAVTLKCGHSFNYIPLYKEVLFQKCSTLPKNISSRIIALYTKTMNPYIGNTAAGGAIATSTPLNNIHAMTYNSSINLETMKLHYNEIKCPYCRDITPKLLPYYPYPEVNQIKYVNSPVGLCLKGVSCQYYSRFANKPVGSECIVDKTCESFPIYNEEFGILCRPHLKKVLAAKVAAETKAKSKTGISKPKNSIVSHIDPSTLPTEEIYSQANNKCGFLLLSGPRKGQPCGGCSFKFTSTTDSSSLSSSSSSSMPLCKRHYNK